MTHPCSGFEGVAGGHGSVLCLDLGGDGGGLRLIRTVREEARDQRGGGFGFVLFAGEDLSDAELADAAGIVGLIVTVGHDEHGAAGAEGLGGGSDAALVDEDGGAGKDLRIRSVANDADGVREFAFRQIAIVGADEENGALAEALSGLGALLVEVAGMHDCGGAESEDERRRPRIEKSLQGGLEAAFVAGAIVKGEAGDLRGRRPVGLRRAHHG